MAFDSGYGRQFVVFASELASAIEQHPYQPREETALKVWKRFDDVSFGFAVALVYIREVFELTKAFIKEGMPALQHPLPNEVETDQGKQSFVATLREIFTSIQWVKLRRKIRAFVDTKEFRDAREKDILNALGENQKVQEAMVALCTEEKKTVNEKVQEVCKKITQETGKEVDKKTQAALTSRLSKDRGTKLEAKTVVEFAASSGKAVRREPAKLYQKIMHYNDLSWELRGRVDARDNDTIVEVKNRTRRFMCPDYDVLQLQAYMFLCDKKKGILLERLHGENHETPFEFNQSYWDHAVVPALYEFISDIEEKVIASRTLLDNVTPTISPRKRKAPFKVTNTTPKKQLQSSPEDKLGPKGMFESPKKILEGSSWDNVGSSSAIGEQKRINEGSSWDNLGSSDTEIGSSQGNDSFVLYLSMSETESDEELANLPL